MQVQHFALHTHKHRKEQMLTMNFFNGFRKLMADKSPHDRDIRAWANTEYKFDADYAYTVIKETGKMPEVGVAL